MSEALREALAELVKMEREDEVIERGWKSMLPPDYRSHLACLARAREDVAAVLAAQSEQSAAPVPASDDSRADFETFFAWSRKGSGRICDENMLNRNGAEYVKDSTQRHWWTWQNARTAKLVASLPVPESAAPADRVRVERDALRSALERLAYNYRLTLAGKPVRDVSETFAEVDAALKADGEGEMTVAELIRELQAMPNPNAAVKVRVDVSSPDNTGADWEEADIDEVRNEGPFVSLGVAVTRRFRWSRKTYQHAHQLARLLSRYMDLPDHPPALVLRYWELWGRHRQQTDPLEVPLKWRLDRFFYDRIISNTARDLLACELGVNWSPHAQDPPTPVRRLIKFLDIEEWRCNRCWASVTPTGTSPALCQYPEECPFVYPIDHVTERSVGGSEHLDDQQPKEQMQ